MPFALTDLCSPIGHRLIVGKEPLLSSLSRVTLRFGAVLVVCIDDTIDGSRSMMVYDGRSWSWRRWWVQGAGAGA